MEHLLKAIREANYAEANSYVSDMLYQKLNDKLEDRQKEIQEGCGCNNGNESVQYEASDNDGDEYKKFFQSALKKFGVSSPDELEGDKKKKFYDYVDKNWKSDKEKATGIDEGKKKNDPRFKERGKHDCATHVNHEQFGEGRCIHSQHATPDENGNIAWYDVMFEHGIEKGVSINELKVVASEMHEDHHDVEEGAELDIAKEKEKMAASQEKIRDLSVKMKREKQRKRDEA